MTSLLLLVAYEFASLISPKKKELGVKNPAGQAAIS